MRGGDDVGICRSVKWEDFPVDDLRFGTRTKRGDWAPNDALQVAPFWTGRFDQLGRFVIGYLWPWNAFHMAVTLLYWFVLLPDMEVMRMLGWGWAARLYAANAAGIFALYGAVELFYYVKRKQGTRFKYNHRFPAENPSDVFWFKSQNIDNFLRSFFISIPLWTFVQVVALHVYAIGWATWLPWSSHWLWLSVLVLLAPALHEVHFYAIHRTIHQGWLYKYIHSVHHNSINPSPWSSLSMHPVEGFLYFVEMWWHLLLPSNPVVAMFQLNMIGFGALNGHIGFDKLEITEEQAITSHAYTHYLHHKYFEVNYGGDGLVPLDKWLGTWHDGTKDADERMKERFRQKKLRVAARNEGAATK